MREELGAGPVPGPEEPEHRRRRHHGPGLADAAHRHAEMLRLDDNQHAANENIRLQNLWDGIDVYVALFEGLK